VDFEIRARGVTALFGPSGCGKTTTLRCLAGLDRMAHGSFSVDGEAWQDRRHFLPPHKRAIGYVFQDANLFPHLSVRANLLFGARRAGKNDAGTGPAFDELVELLGLRAMLDRAPSRLSGGERQRVAIGRALLSQPRLLLMDEPLSALDARNKGEILPYLERLVTRLPMPVVYVTHAPDEVARLADHLVVLDNGRVIASGPLTEVTSRLDLPIRDEENAGVILHANIVERDEPWHLARAAIAGGSLWVRDSNLRMGQAVRIRVLARDVSLALEQSEDTSIQNRMPAAVREIAQGDHPAVRLVRLDIGGSPLLSRLTARSVDQLRLAPGKTVWAQIKSVAVIG